MKPMFFLPAAALALALALPATAAETIRGSGQFANFLRGDANYSMALYASVGDAYTQLSFQVSRCTPYSCELIGSGFGNLPAQMLQVTNNGRRATINIPDIAQLPNFARSGPVMSGAINATFERDGVEVRTFRGHQRITSPAMSYILNGTSEYSSASVTGTVLGVPIPAAGFAEIGVNRNMSIIFERTR